jgi:hypothetical protein
VVIRAVPVLPVVFDDLGGAAEVAAGAASPPEGRVEPGVELAVDGEEVADVVPLQGEAPVVLPDV